MLTIKLMKYGPKGKAETPNTYTEAIAMHAAKDVYLQYEDGGRAVLYWVTTEGEERVGGVTVGQFGETSYDAAYILNEHGRTIDTIR